jgi:hypothetical protein
MLSKLPLTFKLKAIAIIFVVMLVVLACTGHASTAGAILTWLWNAAGAIMTFFKALFHK